MADKYLLYYYIFASLASYLVTGQAPQYGGRGLAITLIPTIPGPPEDILWKHKGNKVVEFDGSEQRVYGSFDQRVILDWQGAELIIKDLRHEDSGPYELEITINKNLHYSHHNVEVIDEVAEPTISCVINDTSSTDTSEIQATLVCSAEPRGPPALMKFDWSSPGGPRPGRELSLSAKGKHDDAVYSCRVSNPVSEKTASFTAKDCYPDESSSVIGVVIGIVAIVIVFIILLLGFCFVWYRRRNGNKATQPMQKNTNELESQPLRSTPEENGDSGHSQTGMSDETSETGNVARKRNFYNELGASSEKGAQPPPLSNNYSPRKIPFLPDSVADTQTGSEINPDDDPEKQHFLNNGATLPSTQPLAQLAQSGQDLAPGDTTSEHEGDADSVLVTVKPAETECPERDTPVFEKANEPDSNGEPEKPNEENKLNLQSPTTPEPGLNNKLPEPEPSKVPEEAETQAHATESIQEEQQDLDPPVSGLKDEDATSEHEEDAASDLDTVKPGETQHPEHDTPVIDNINEPWKGTPETGNVARKRNFYNECVASSEKGAQPPPLSNIYSPSKELFPPDSVADTQTGSEINPDDDQEKDADSVLVTVKPGETQHPEHDTPVIDKIIEPDSIGEPEKANEGSTTHTLSEHEPSKIPEETVTQAHTTESSQGEQQHLGTPVSELKDEDATSKDGEDAECPEDDTNEEKANELESVGKPEKPNEENKLNLQSTTTSEPPEHEPSKIPEEMETQARTAESIEGEQQDLDRLGVSKLDTVSDSDQPSDESALSSPLPQQPQSPEETIPDNTNSTNTSPVQSDADVQPVDDHVDPNAPRAEQESADNCHDTDMSEGHSQTDLCTAAEHESQSNLKTADQKNETQSCPNEVEPGKEGMSGSPSPSPKAPEVVAGTGMDVEDGDGAASAEKATTEMKDGVMAAEHDCEETVPQSRTTESSQGEQQHLDPPASELKDEDATSEHGEDAASDLDTVKPGETQRPEHDTSVIDETNEPDSIGEPEKANGVEPGKEGLRGSSSSSPKAPEVVAGTGMDVEDGDGAASTEKAATEMKDGGMAEEHDCVEEQATSNSEGADATKQETPEEEEHPDREAEKVESDRNGEEERGQQDDQTAGQNVKAPPSGDQGAGIDGRDDGDTKTNGDVGKEAENEQNK